ncbi:MAG: hypothetical protein ABI649_07035 [Gaiellaceae bacterium]
MDALTTRSKKRLWRTVAVLALGVAIGTMIMATPAAAHFQASISHIWSHIKPLADTRYTNRASNARVDEGGAAPVTLAEYGSYTNVVQTSLTTKGASSKVLIVGQFSAQNTSSNSGDLFGQALADGTKVDGVYWASLGATAAPVNPRAQLSVSRVITLGPGPHTITLQGAYYDGGTDQTVIAYARSISAVELN